MTPTPIPYFDHAVVAVDHRAELGEVPTTDATGAKILAAFMRLENADRLADSRHVYAYYRDIHDTVGGEEALDPYIGVPATPDAIWRFVHPREIYIMAGQDGDPHAYVFAACDCDWEPEHGLTLVWRDGTTLCKAGPYDGHNTNAAAFDDQTLEDVVYPAIETRYRTFIDRS